MDSCCFLNLIDGFDLAVHRWKCFMSSKRHEVSELTYVSDNVILSVRWDQIRDLTGESPVIRGVGVGSMLSPAAVGGHGSLFSNQCVWGNCDALGTQLHICWECDQRRCVGLV